MRDPAWIARIEDHRGKPIRQAQPPLGRGQQHHAAIRGDPSAVERGRDLLARDGWKRKPRRRIVGHGGCGSLDAVGRVGISNQILRYINRLGYIRQLAGLTFVN